MVHSGPYKCNITTKWNKTHIQYFSQKWFTVHITELACDTTNQACNRQDMGLINGIKILVVKPEGKRPLEKTRHRWEDTIKTELK
jgi:hypothetical protein